LAIDLKKPSNRASVNGSKRPSLMQFCPPCVPATKVHRTIVESAANEIL
jgi:hypothetical protein